jgi:copper homeostasis protein
MLCIELCVASLDAIRLAKKLQIDRVEVCQNLESGGLTPPATLVKSALDLGLKTHVLIRPRVGGFVYSEAELELIKSDLSFFTDLGVDGAVIGALMPDHRIHSAFLSEVKKDFPTMDLTFHKAFDDTPDWKSSLDTLMDIGIQRVLSSGCNDHVIRGMSTLKLMFEHAQGRIEILPGGGLNNHNIDFFLKNIQPSWVHFSGCKKTIDRTTSNFESPLLKLDKNMIKEMIKVSKNYSFSMGAISSDM